MKRTWIAKKRKARPAAETRAMRAYREAHPRCEACRLEPSSDTHHINSEGSGGPSEDWNFLALCQVCHIGIFHTGGWKKFCDRFPHLAGKIVAARMRMGRKV